MTKEYPKQDLAFIEKNFRLNWAGRREKIKPYLSKPLRTTVSAPRLIEIIGENHAHYLFGKMIEMKDQKKTFSIRDKGKLTVYCI